LPQIEELVEDAAEDEVVVYVDEVDIHVNPKIGWHWMMRGHQKRFLLRGRT